MTGSGTTAQKRWGGRLHVGVQEVATKVSHVSSGPENVGGLMGCGDEEGGATIDLCDTQRERMHSSQAR